MKIAFVIEMDKPKNARIEDVKRYIEEALTAWGGSLEPEHETDDDGCLQCGTNKCERPYAGDPMFGLHEVRVGRRIS